MQTLQSHGVIANAKQTVCGQESPDIMPQKGLKTKLPSAWLTVTTTAWWVTTAAGSSQCPISRAARESVVPQGEQRRQAIKVMVGETQIDG